MITEERSDFRSSVHTKDRFYMPAAKTFEQNLKALEKIVEKLESGSVSLDDAIGLFQKGKKLSGSCEKRLKEAELKIQNLIEDETTGELKTEEFEPPTPSPETA